MEYTKGFELAVSASPFVNTQPISKKRIEEFNPQIVQIYGGKKGEVTFVPIEQKISGTAIGSICCKENDKRVPPKRWMAKVGSPLGMLRNNPMSITSRTLAEMNLHTILEKIAVDLYQELGQGLFEVPKTRLAKMPIMDAFTANTHPSVRFYYDQGTTHTLRVASRYVDEYQDFEHVQTEHGLFIAYIIEFKRPPEKVLTPEGKLVPLIGFCGLLGVGRVLADTDVIGGKGGNAGIRWIHNKNGIIIAAQTVKIDPGFAFQFTDKDNVNWAINKREQRPGTFQLEDLKDLQIANNDSRVTIEWKALTQEQKDSYLAALLNCARYLQADEILQFLFFRDAKFSRAPTECIHTGIANTMAEQMQAWTIWQLEIYQEEVQSFQLRHPEHSLRIHYIDKWGELELPMANEKFLVRDLFTELSIVSAEEQKAIENEAKQKSSLEQSFARLHTTHKAIALDQLFIPENGRTVRKVLLTGAAGIGKSTLCQKIAHDWASNRLFEDRFKAVYWIPLRLLNSAVAPGQALHGLAGHEELLARILATFVLNQPELEDALCQQIRNHRMEILVLLDGYDEAQPILRNVLKPLLEDPEMHLVLTSRPGVTEGLEPFFQRTVENLGFADRHVKSYCTRFFTRRDDNQLTQQRQISFLAELRKHAFFEQIAHIPLQLQMLCSLWEQGAEGSGLATSITTLYEGMIEQLLRWQCRKKNQDPLDISPAYKKRLYSALGQIGENSLLQGKLMLPQQYINNVLETYDLTEKDLLESGLLKATGTGLNTHYHFLHLTFQEYLVARWISRKSPNEQRAFIQENRDKQNYSLIMAFLAGAIYQAEKHGSIKMATQVFFATLSQDLLNLERKPKESLIKLLLYCLNECPGYLADLPSLECYLENFHKVRVDGRLLGYWIGEKGLLHALQWIVQKKSLMILKKSEICIAAASKGHIELLQWLYDQDPSFIHETSSDNRSVWFFAAQGGHVSVLNWLWGKAPSRFYLWKPDRYGETPMHAAAGRGHILVMDWLWQKVPSVHLQLEGNMHGATPMDFAASSGHVAALEWFFKKDPSFVYEVRSYSNHPLDSAAYQGHLALLDWWWKKDPLFCQKITNDGQTILYSAIAGMRVEVLDWLWEKKLSPHLLQQSDDQGRLPLDVALEGAANSGDVSVLDWLWKKDPSLPQTIQKGQAFLHRAAAGGHLVFLNWLCEKSTSLDVLQTVDKEGQTLFHLAAKGGYVAVMDWLWQRSPSLDALQAVDKEGQTLFHLAAKGGHVAVLDWLWLKSPSLDALQAVDKEGQTLFHAAIQGRHIVVMDWLCQKNPSPELLEQTDANGMTPLHLAIKGCWDVKLLDWLWQKNPSPKLLEQSDAEGMTPLHLAIKRHSDVSLLDWLWQKNPSLESLEQTDAKGMTPLHLAAWYGNLAALKWLCQKDPGLSLLQKTDSKGRIPLDLAIEESPNYTRKPKRKILEFLWKKIPFPALLQKTDSEGRTLLHNTFDEVFLGRGDVKLLDWLWEKGPSFELLKKMDSKGRTILYATLDQANSRYTDIPLLAWLWDKAPVLFLDTNKKGQTPLHVAVSQGSLELLDWLYQKIPSLLQTVDKEGQTLYHLAVIKKNLQVLEWLWEKDSSHILQEKENREHQTPLDMALVAAISDEKVMVLDWFLEKNPSILARIITSDYLQTALDEAVTKGHLVVLNWLWNQGASRDIMDLLEKEQRRPYLHSAAGWGQIATLQWLWEKDPSLLQKVDAEGMTPFHAAAQGGHVKVLKWLWQKDPSLLKRKDNRGKTALDRAIEQGKSLARRLEQGDFSARNRAIEGNFRAQKWLKKKLLDTTL